MAVAPVRPPFWARRSTLERALAVLTPIALLLVWEVAARNDWVDRRILAPPTEVAATIYEEVTTGGILRDVWYTSWRFVLGMLAGTIPGIAIGLVMGLFWAPRAVLRPLIQVIYPLPRIALFPIILIFWGTSETSNLLMIALGPFFTMIITTMAAVLEIDPIYHDVARSFDTPHADLYRRVTIPAALPVIMGGVRVSLGLALLGTTAVEFLVAQEGLGHVIWRSWQLLSLRMSLAGLVLASLLGLLAFVFVDWLEQRLIPWKAD